MPYLANGEHVDIIINALGVINRLNSAQLFEVSLNFIGRNIQEKIKTLDKLKDKEDIVFKFLKYFNERGFFGQLQDYYYKLSEEDKNEFFNEIERSGVFVHIPPMWEDEPLFDKLSKIYDEFPWIQPYDVYVNKFGRSIKMMNKLIIGEQYIIKMKQASKKGFSARSMGFINQKGLDYNRSCA